MERARRLRKGSEFDAAYKKGTVTSGPLLVLRVLPNDSETTRWGFAVGKRISKKAVVRNRIRRRLREVARALDVVPGNDIVVTVRPGVLDMPSGQLRAALERVARRANVLAEGGTP